MVYHRGGTVAVLVMGMLLLLVMLPLLLLMGVVMVLVAKMLGVVVWLEAMRLVVMDLLLMGLILTRPHHLCKMM